MSPDDEAGMRRAIAVARTTLGLTVPNPAVGCVLMKDGGVLAEAATAPGGRPHAEEQALAAAGEGARGATAYVTLEPCGARSSGAPSCAQRLAEAGVVRVVVACEDPSPFASGQGLHRLAQAGVEVASGVLAPEAAELSAEFVAGLNAARRP
ncbi:MAG TPA: bifunctional diaminohydroxyphosphoribosylaminopyrimidine deaminase/5-amino-6-(5-phosphoribosylamino)uracil reductase RibD [Caulobacteraceae bacterium]